MALTSSILIPIDYAFYSIKRCLTFIGLVKRSTRKIRNEVNKRKIGLGWTTSVYVSNKVSNVFNPFAIFVLLSSFFTQINPLASSKAPLTYS